VEGVRWVDSICMGQVRWIDGIYMGQVRWIDGIYIGQVGGGGGGEHTTAFSGSINCGKFPLLKIINFLIKIRGSNSKISMSVKYS
jgi:hypothetical protein